MTGMQFVIAPQDGDSPKDLPFNGRMKVGAARPPTRVLIVEDEWLVSLEIEAVLLDAGYQVVGVAVTADEAVKMAERLKPDLATMDIRLHGARDGVDAATELYQRFGIRCLFISAYSSSALKDRASASKPLGWLQKPFVPSQMAAAMRDALRKLERSPG